ncbi:DUF429 domain-containing protein [Corynebacterium jeddahense]|uniref:DUF429 domain-containing protein n=2 Tax=Corynebacterium jeddahense TaxID=1414719 RepID=A0ABY7UII3_9CORY|nr:DUF429 domain-containing protein [Corynebacterium jeddahense]WCZ38557.1 hypothetical protein CJEDD_04720 [Corynebacterium jeddahense]
MYPAAALKRWGLLHRGYKGSAGRGAGAGREARAAIMDGLQRRFALDWNGFEAAVLGNADCLDAVVAALVAREVAAGRCVPPPAGSAELVAEEGGIWIPKGDTGSEPSL